MILTIALSLIYVEIKNSAFQKICTEITRKFWSLWELRLMVVVSLILQLVLVVSGNLRRGYIGKKLPCVAITVWFVYLSADWMATLVLSTLLRGDVKLKHGLIVYWTPFLLWHLGSPYNITAYSLEDNELWLRHFLGMVFQVLEAAYIYVRFRSDSELNFMAVPIFLAGVFKYGERIWALRCANDKQLIKSLVESRKARKRQEKIIRIGLPESEITECFRGKGNVPGLNLLREAYSSFIVFKPLFLDLPFRLSAKFHGEMVYTESKSAEEAFKLVGAELGYLYDLLFTKRPFHHQKGKLSLSLRALCFLSAVSSLIAFSVIRDKSVDSTVDIVITYLLLLGAISLDIYSFIMHALSPWAMIKLPNPQKEVHKLYSEVASSWLHSVEANLAIKSMAQHDLINYYVSARKNKFIDAVKIIDTGNLLQKYGHTNWKPVDCELKQFIYSHLNEKRHKLGEDFKPEDLDKLLNAKGESMLADIHSEDLQDDTADFAEYVFRWHFATGLVYYDDLHKFRRGTKSLSDYMIYLVLVRPLMLPKGFSEVINDENYKQANIFFPAGDMVDTRDHLRKTFTSAVLSYPDDSGTESHGMEVINRGRKFAKKLQEVVTQTGWDHEEKWEMISKVWMDMMIYAASHCSWKEHAQQLRHGGELLTHVALLMAHLGLSTQIRKDRTLDDESNLPFFPLAED